MPATDGRQHRPTMQRGVVVARWRAFWLLAFWITFGSTLVAIVGISLLSRRQSFETGAARQVRKVGPIAYEAEFPGRLPETGLVGCGGFELTPATSADEVLREPGRYWIDADHSIVRWSPRRDSPVSQGQIPIAILVIPGTLERALGDRLLLFLIPASILAAAGTLVAIGNKSQASTPAASTPAAANNESLLSRACGAFRFYVTQNPKWRIACVAAVGIALAFSMVPDWNRLVTCTDSRSYVENLPIRTPLTGWWIAAFDCERSLPRAGSLPPEARTISHWGPSHRYINAVRVWKVLFVVAVCAFAWALSSIVPWWMAASLVLAAAALDASRGAWSTGMSGYLDVLLSEPLSGSLLLLLLAALCAYFWRPGWLRGLALVACLNLLILARPASLAFVFLIGGVWALHWRREGVGFAFRRAGALAALFLAGIGLQCAHNWAQYGYFRQHAFAGMSLMTTTLQVADANDARDLSDPQLARFAQATLERALATRQYPFGPGAADTNCWRCAVPAFDGTYGVTAEDAPFLADDVLTRFGRILIRRHPREFLKLAVSSYWDAFGRGWILAPLILTFSTALGLYLRGHDWRLLFVACLAALPLVGMIPSCLLNFPLERYQSLTSFAEIWSLPILIATLLTRSRGGARVVALDGDRDASKEQATSLAA
jgi:hypothetical protein